MARAVPSDASRPVSVGPGGTRRLAWLGATVCVLAVTIAAAGSPPDTAFGRGLLELLIVGVPVAAGVYALRIPGSARFGVALLAIGFCWSLTALGQTSASVPYTIGRLASWLVLPGVVYLLLAFPDGRVAAGLDRALLLGFAGVMLVLFFGTAPLVETFPPKTLWATCTTDCPANAVFILDRQPAWLPKLVLVREWLVEVLWIGLLWSMLRRWRAASPLQRRATGPVFVAGALLGVSHIGHITYRQLGGPTDTVIAVSSIWTVCIVAVCATFLFAMARRRALLADALATLGLALRPGTSSAQTRDALAVALGDPTIQTFHQLSDGDWCDASSRRVPLPDPAAPGRALTGITAPEGSRGLVVEHDAALRDDPELLHAAGTMVLRAWDQERVVADLARAMGELEASRRRVAAAADLERARIERDLHDGAQQRLLALRIRLTLLEDQLKTDASAGIEEIRALGFEAELALDELRALAHGVYPSLLVDRGVVDALRSMALQAPIPIRVVAQHVGRQPIQIESAVYFTCVEAAQNATKHALSADGAEITLDQSSTTLRFAIRDCGPGFCVHSADGRGLRNMRDRMEAVGGHLIIDSRPGRGTRVLGSVPLTGD